MPSYLFAIGIAEAGAMNHNSHFEILYDATALAAPTSDCNCACPAPRPFSSIPPLPSGTQLQRHPELQTLPLSAEHSVVFVPSLSRVAVLDHAALELLERFAEPHMLDTLSDSERDAAQQLYYLNLLQRCGTARAPEPSDELIAWLHVTNACNLRCTYCYIHKSDEAMSAETAFAAIDAILRSARCNGYRRVLLKYAGGEASLNLPLVDAMHRYANEQAAEDGIAIKGVVLSNGVGLSRRRLKQIHELGLRLMISLDGPQATHDAQRPTIHGRGSYAAATASVERARELGLDLTISVTITGSSVADLPELVDWLLKRDLHFSLNFYRENTCSAGFHELQLDEQRLIAGLRAAYQVIEQHLPRHSLLGCLLDRTHLGAPHQRTCAVGENYLVIDQRGQIAKCQMEIEHTVTNVWEPDPLRIIRLDRSGVQNLRVDEKQGCRECEWRYWCAGGCALTTLRATGRYDIRSPNCGIYKALYPDVLRLEGLRLLYWRHATASAETQ
jgi:uncharacterized protein